MVERDLQKEFDELKSELGKLQGDLARVAEQGTTVAKDVAGVAKDRLEDEAQKLVNRVQETAESAATRGRDLIADVERRVEERPVPSAFMALGIGVMLGFMLTRR